MIAIMLCAGFGTRLQPMTRTTPKGLLVVGGKRILDYQMPQLLDLPDLEAIHLVTNARYIAGFYDWLETWREALEERGVALHLHNDGSLDEDTRLGAVGDLSFLLDRIGTDRPVVVTAGDNIYRFPLRPVAERFLAGDDNLVLALHEPSYQVRQRYAVLELGDDDRVVRIHDSPEEPPTDWVAPSLYFLQPRALGRIRPFLQEGGAFDSIPTLLDHLLEVEPVRAVRKANESAWLDIETRYMFRKANEVLEAEPLMLE